MLSRVADSLYWLGRYLERAEDYARFLDVNFNLSLDLPPGVSEQWRPLIEATGDLNYYNTRFKNFARQDAIFFLAFDRENLNSIISSIRFARENARIIRENISKESWEALNDLYHYVNKAYNRKIWLKEDPKDFFKSIRQKVELIYGIAFSTAIRVEGWYFSQIGQYLERADKTSRILDVKYHMLLPTTKDVGSPLDFLQWGALLKSVSGFNAYRRYYGKIEPVNVVEYLVLNQYFPRSVYFCIKEAENSLRAISGNSQGDYNPAEKAIGNLRSDLEFADINEIISYGLHEYLDNLQKKINVISDRVYEQYFKIQANFTQQNQSQ